MTEILKRIKNETADWHSRIETLVPVFHEGFNLAGYRRLLARFYGFYLPYEAAAGRVPGLKRRLPDWPERLKTPAIAADLCWLGATNADLLRIPRCSLLPLMSDLSSLFGALYVTEGSTLGGQLISRHLQQSLGLAPASGATFFSGHGDKTGTKWRTFTETLCGMATPHNESVIVQSAVDTFRMLWLWLAEDQEPGIASDRPYVEESSRMSS